jgi:hypothetical protein
MAMPEELLRNSLPEDVVRSCRGASPMLHAGTQVHRVEWKAAAEFVKSSVQPRGRDVASAPKPRLFERGVDNRPVPRPSDAVQGSGPAPTMTRADTALRQAN